MWICGGGYEGGYALSGWLKLRTKKGPGIVPGPFVLDWFSGWLKPVVQAKLHEPSTRLCRSDAPKLGCVDVVARNIKTDGVCEIEHFSAQIEVLLLCYGDALLDCHIRVPENRTVKDAATKASQLAGARIEEDLSLSWSPSLEVGSSRVARDHIWGKEVRAISLDTQRHQTLNLAEGQVGIGSVVGRTGCAIQCAAGAGDAEW